MKYSLRIMLKVEKIGGHWENRSSQSTAGCNWIGGHYSAKTSKKTRGNMCFIIKNKILRIMKNPVYYIGGILMLIFVYMQCSKYLQIKYITSDSEIKIVDEDSYGDADVMDGYIPMSEEEKVNIGFENLRSDLIEVVGLDENQVDALCTAAQTMEVKDAIDYIEKECPSLSNINYYFFGLEAKKQGTAAEINTYIRDAVNKENFIDYFGRKYVDYLGTALVFFCLIIYPFFYSDNSKKDIYELLHTKPISGRKYILSQVLGGILAGLLIIVIITIAFQIIIYLHKGRLDFPVNIMGIWKYVLACLVPSIVYISSVFLFICNIFKSPFPAIPILFIQILYSNAGVTNSEGVFEYNHRLGAVLIRYPELFFETKTASNFFFNQIALIVFSVIFLILGIVFWEKKRV